MIIIYASRKGGVGKSTLLCNIAGALAQKGESVAIVETDPQKTAFNWATQRSEIDTLKPVATFFSEIGRALEVTLRNLVPAFKYILVDLQGVDSEKNRFVLQYADRVVFPFKPSQPDLDTLEWITELRADLRGVKPSLKAFYVINEAPTTTQIEKKEAKQYFAAMGAQPIETIIHARKSFRDSMAKGFSAVEMHDVKARAEIEGLLDEILGEEPVFIESTEPVEPEPTKKLKRLSSETHMTLI